MGAMYRDRWKRVGGQRKEGWAWQWQAQQWDRREEILELCSAVEQDSLQCKMAGLGRRLGCN